MSNSISVVGNLTDDAKEVTVGNINAIKFSVADNVGYGDRKSTNFFNITYFRKAGNLLEYLKKGTQVHLSGEFTARPWKDKNGIDKISLDLKPDQLSLLGSKSSGSSTGKAAQPAATNNAQAPAQTDTAPAQTNTAPTSDEDEVF